MPKLPTLMQVILMSLWLKITRLPLWIAMGLIQCYQCSISAVMARHCRFYPTCSAYALAALDRYGLLKGSLLALRRLLRCHPWHPGGFDPVPNDLGSLFAPVEPESTGQ